MVAPKKPRSCRRLISLMVSSCVSVVWGGFATSGRGEYPWRALPVDEYCANFSRRRPDELTAGSSGMFISRRAPWDDGIAVSRGRTHGMPSPRALRVRLAEHGLER